MAYRASYHDSEGKMSFLRHPTPPFDIDFVGCEQQSDDTDEDWLPDVKDVISGNYSVLIDLTGDSDNEVGHHLHETRVSIGTLTSGAPRVTSSPPPRTREPIQRPSSQHRALPDPSCRPLPRQLHWRASQ